VGRCIWIYPLDQHSKIGRYRPKRMHVFDEPIGHISDGLSVAHVDEDGPRVHAVVRLVP